MKFKITKNILDEDLNEYSEEKLKHLQHKIDKLNNINNKIANIWGKTNQEVWTLDKLEKFTFESNELTLDLNANDSGSREFISEEECLDELLSHAQTRLELAPKAKEEADKSSAAFLMLNLDDKDIVNDFKESGEFDKYYRIGMQMSPEELSKYEDDNLFDIDDEFNDNSGLLADLPDSKYLN